jgi:hypothetical protein
LILILGVCLLTIAAAYFAEGYRQTALVHWQGFEKDSAIGAPEFVYTFAVLIDRLADGSSRDSFQLTMKAHFDRITKTRYFREIRLKVEDSLTKSRLR